MYQPNHAPPFGSPQSRDPPGRPGGFAGAPSGLRPSGFSPSRAESHFRHNKPQLVRPQCSSFPVDYYSMIGLGGTYRRLPHWNPTPAQGHLPDNSDRASEEFLRCIAANKPLPSYLKGNMEYNLADAFKSAHVVKEAVRSDPDLQKLLTRSKSRAKSRARSRSRGKSHARSRSRGKSRARSRSRGKSRARSRSRGKSRARSRSRGKSRARSRSRGKSRARSRSRGRSKSRARGKSALRERHRSRSQTRISSPTQSRSRGQRSSSSSSEKDQEKKEQRKRSSKSSSSVDKDENPTGRCLLKGLKIVLSSRELEGRFCNLQDAFLGVKASNESKTDKLFPGQKRNFQGNSAAGEDPIILPHDRVGSDFSWLQGPSQKDQKERDFEAEESFLYGNEESKSSEIFSCRERHGRAQEPQHEHLRNVQQHLQNTSRMASALLDSTECEKIKSILKCLGPADTAKGQALEASFSKAAQEVCTRQDGNGSSQVPAGTHKTDDEEQRSRLKRATTSQMELLMKELQKLMKHNGFDFLTPVIGFYCQKCEEFFGDWSSAENHAALHRCSCSSEVRLDKCAGGREMHSHHSNRDGHAHRCPPDKKDSNYHSNPGEQLMDRGWREEQDRRNRHHTEHTTRKESLFLEEEMKKERMLITVSQEPDPPAHINLHKELQSIQSEKTVKTKSQKKKKTKKKKDGKKKNKKDKS